MLPNSIRNKLKDASKMEPQHKYGMSNARTKVIDNIISEAMISNPECFQPELIARVIDKIAEST